MIRRAIYFCLSLSLAGLAFYLLSDTSDFDTEVYDESAPTTYRGPLSPLPQIPDQDPRLVSLGRELFHETRLSIDNTRSCASCHQLDSGGDDGRVYSLGVHDKSGSINAPTVYNSSLNVAQFWDGRASSLEVQAEAPITDPSEMGSNWPHVLSILSADTHYASQFLEVFQGPATRGRVLSALASYERTLLTKDSPFDRFLEGDSSALSASARRGYDKFLSLGCASCHQGANVGGNMYQKFGVMADYFEDRGHVTKADLGRFNVTGDPKDRFVFKVPSLRNVSLTAPYFHDGSAATLEQAIKVMGRYQLGRSLDAQEVSDLKSFLESLKGAQPK